MNHGVDAVGGQGAVHKRCQRVNAEGQQVRKRRADDPEGQPEHQRHNADKAGQGGVFAGQHAVDGNAALMLAAFAGAHHGFFAQSLNKAKAHIRQRCLAVQPGVAFQFGDRMPQHIGFVFVKIQRPFDQRIALHQLGGGKAGGQPGTHGVVFDQVVDGVDAAVYRTVAPVGGIAKVDAPGAFAVAGNVQRVFDQLVNALVFGGRNRHHRHAQQILQLVDHHGAAVGAHLVHHIQRQHHRDAQLHQLHGQIEVALDIGRIYDIYNAVRVGVQQKVAGDDLLAGIGRQRVDARQIGHDSLAVTADDAVLAVHRHAGKVADVLVGAGQLVEQRRLAAVLVARQGKFQRLPLGDDRAVFAVVVAGRLAQFAHAGVGDRGVAALIAGGAVGFVNVVYLDFGGIRQAQRQLVSAQLQLNGVTHGGNLAQGHLGTRRKPHIQQVMAQLALAADGAQDGILTDF